MLESRCLMVAMVDTLVQEKIMRGRQVIGLYSDSSFLGCLRRYHPL